ncbi:ATP-binding protein [Clostridium sp.]|uniref:two-component system sensor histidine kinase NtrB n=1 Tax=Clostridium sp. TaxID=1506 RepID=UPI001A454E7F|nr:ATP-binding protein [Clostridium sp.]MBK5242782.1 PAS domain S-box protein [Clostridium sp.]
MIFSEVSCKAENSLKKIDSLGITKLAKADEVGICTITQNNKVYIDACLKYNENVGDLKLILNCIASKIFKLEDKTEVFNLSEYGEERFILAIPIRAYFKYKVYFVFHNMNGFTKEQITSVSAVVFLLYENVLLNHDVLRERNYLDSLFDSLESIVIGLDKAGFITSGNKTVEKIFKLHLQDILGNKFIELKSIKDKRNIFESINKVIKYNRSCIVKEEIFIIEGEKVYMDIIFSPVNNSRGEIDGIVIVMDDITNRKIYEKEIEQLNQFAFLGEVAAGIAHNIKNPLTNIKGCGRILEKKLIGNEYYNDFILPITKEADRIDDVINKMLSYTFITQEDIYGYISVEESINKCFDILSFHIKSKDIKMTKDIEKDLPLIKGNNVQLQQAFINILFNAMQAVECTGKIEITCEKLSKKDTIKICIADNGKGIEENNIKNIFKPFFSTRNDGNGFGLAIVKLVIEKFYGTIEVESKLGIGTKFMIYLPYKEL